MMNLLHQKNLPAWLPLGLLLSAVTLVYWNHFDNAFQFDDHHTIVTNHFITDLSNSWRFFQDTETTSSLPTNQDYRPIVTLLNAIDYWLGDGLNTRAFHWHNFVHFLLILVLVYGLAMKLFRLADARDHRWTALFATALFGLHTANAETINYIIARSDVFSTLMVLAGLMIFISNQGLKRHWALLPFVVGCLTKPTTLMLAPLLAMFCLLMERPSLLVRSEQSSVVTPIKRAVYGSWPYFVAGVLLFAFAQSMKTTWTPGGSSTPLEYLNTQAWVVWIYLKTFFLPTGLSADTDLMVIREFFSPRVLWGIAVIAAVLTAALVAARNRASLPITFGILWFFIALVPSSSIITLAEVMNHHRTFFPYIGLAIAASWAALLAFEHLTRNGAGQGSSALAAVLAAGVLAAHAWGTIERNEVWHSEESLWRDVTEKSPANGRGQMNYGLALMQRGDIDGAIAQFEKALETSYGNHSFLFINLGIGTNVLARKAGSEELRAKAESYFQQAINKGPNLPQTHFYYARWLHEQGRDDNALTHASKAIALSPAHKAARELRDTLAGTSEMRLAAVEQVARKAGTATALINLSLRYFKAARHEDCIKAARTALTIEPNSAIAYNNICSAHNALGQHDLAIEACQRAVDIDPGFQLARNNLEWARVKKAEQ